MDRRENAAREMKEQAQKPRTNILVEFLQFLAHNKKWWLLPLAAALLVVALLLFLGTTGAAPFIYTLF